MKAIPLTLIICSVMGGGLFFSESAPAHGGQYRGPASTAPPTMSGGASSNPVGATGVGPAAPAATGPSGGEGVKTTRSSSPGGMERKASSAGPGFDRWEFWWEYNKDAYLNLKNKLFGNEWVSGGSSFLCGRKPKSEFHSSRQATAESMKAKVLPILLDALKIDHPDVQDSTVLALARITACADSNLVMGPIRQVLASDYQSAQQSACLSLGVLGAKEAIPTCRNLLFDNVDGKRITGRSKVPRLVRAFAALSLGLIGEDESIPDLLAIIENENPMTQKDLVICAITALGLMHSTEQKGKIVPRLVAMLKDPSLDPFLKAHLPIALGKLEARSALHDLTELFLDKDLNPWVSQSCAIAIGQLAELKEDEEAVDLLMRYVSEGGDAQTRHLSIIALAQIGARDTAFGAQRRLHHKLSRFFLTEMDGSAHNSHKAWAALGSSIHAMAHTELQTETMEKLVHHFLATKNPSFKAAVAVSLGLLNARTTAPLIYKEFCESKDKILQGYLCVGLGLMRWTAAAEKIRVLAAEEPGFFLRLQAAVSLGLMGDTQALNILVDALHQSETLYVVSSSARALGEIGDVTALGPLQGILDDLRSNNLSKAFAVVAMGMIGEKTGIPWNARISENCNYGASPLALVEVMDIL